MIGMCARCGKTHPITAYYTDDSSPCPPSVTEVMPDNLRITLDIFDVEPANIDEESSPLTVDSVEFFDLIADDIAKAVEKALNRSVWVKNYRDIDLS